MKTVLVGLSGGVDSAAVAKILLEQGYRVFGAYLSFCPGSDSSQAREVARKLEIPFSVVNRQKSFEKKVIAPFVESYRTGRTPNPCVECNRNMKIASLLQEADRLGIEMVATGHYARILKGENGRYQLWRGADENKDQSYFLWRLTQKQLSRLIFPLEGLEKETVRRYASGLILPGERESMEICFIPDGDTKGFVKKNGGETPPGHFVDREGKILGKHSGISSYTIGQRRGLGVAMGERYFVTELRPEKGEVVLGVQEDLLTDCFRIGSLHFVSNLKKEVPTEEIWMKGRHRGKPILCRIRFQGREVFAYPKEPTKRFAPGQSAVFYQGEKLLFGGIIEE